MKRPLLLLILLGLLSIICGYLFHKVSFVGRLGINLFHNEYSIFKSWWKSSLAVGGIYTFLYCVQWAVQKKALPNTAKAIHYVAVLLALLGLYLTYNDFRQDITHRILGERFHIGFYLFWLGWIGISLHFLFGRKDSSNA